MEQIYEDLIGSWFVYQNRRPKERYTFLKSLPVGITLIIAVYEVAAGYEIIASAEARTSTGYPAVVGTAETLEEALKIAVFECKEWLLEFE